MKLRRARDRGDVRPLGNEPRKRDLSRSGVLLIADPLQQIHERLVLLHRLRLEARDAFAEVALGQFGVLAHCAGEEALAERTVRHEPDAKFIAGLEDAVGLGRAPP